MFPRSAAVTLLLLLHSASGTAPPTISWSCRNANHSIEVPVVLPAVAHTALLAAGVLQGDPLYRFNEREWSWVADENWTFVGSVSLAADSELLDTDALITMDGIDTVANISINGVRVGETDNAFMSWEFPVSKGLLRHGTNNITVAFTAPRTAARARAAAYPYPVPASIYYHTWSARD